MNKIFEVLNFLEREYGGRALFQTEVADILGISAWEAGILARTAGFSKQKKVFSISPENFARDPYVKRIVAKISNPIPSA